MDRQEAMQRLNQMIGVELHSLAEDYGITIYRGGKVNKGWAGQVFERVLGLSINPVQAPDFGTWELKSIPLKTLKTGRLALKETMAVTMIDAKNVRQREFKDSHLLSKLKKAVVVVRTVGKTVDEPSYIHSVIKFDLSGFLYTAVKADYDLVQDTLLDPNKGFDALSGKMGVYIQPRTKGAGHGSITRAFYARPKFLKEFIAL